jgi:hypothetical protein
MFVRQIAKRALPICPLTKAPPAASTSIVDNERIPQLVLRERGKSLPSSMGVGSSSVAFLAVSRHLPLRDDRDA